MLNKNKPFISSNVTIEVTDTKYNKTVKYDSLLDAASALNINISRIISRINGKSIKPLLKRYVIKAKKNTVTASVKYGVRMQPTMVLIPKNVLFYNDKGNQLVFRSINSAKSFFNVKWSLIKKNLDKDSVINLKGESWRIRSVLPMHSKNN